MNKLLINFNLCIIIFVCAACDPQSGKSTSENHSNDTLRVLSIGNSFSLNATKYLPQLAKEENKNFKLSIAYIGGSSLEEHWSAVEVFQTDPNNKAGRPYKGKSLEDFLTEGNWDIVTIQQVSTLSCDTSEYTPYASLMYNYVKEFQPNTEIVLHQTWPYRKDANRFCQVSEGKYAGSEKEMWEKSRNAYHWLSKKLGVRLIPVGDAFWQVASGENRFQITEEVKNTGDLIAPNLPSQPGSIHVGYIWRDGKLAKDTKHANTKGCFLGSLIWYGFLFNESPKDIDYSPEGINTETSHYLKEVATASLESTTQ